MPEQAARDAYRKAMLAAHRLFRAARAESDTAIADRMRAVEAPLGRPAFQPGMKYRHSLGPVVDKVAEQASRLVGGRSRPPFSGRVLRRFDVLMSQPENTPLN